MLSAACRHLVRWRWGYALAASAILFTLSSFPIRQPARLPQLDKVEHVCAYFLLALSYFNAGSVGGRRIGRAVAAGSWLAVVAFGISDEWHQSFVPGRSAEMLDVLADAVGGALGIAAALRLRGGYVRLSGGKPRARESA